MALFMLSAKPLNTSSLKTSHHVQPLYQYTQSNGAAFDNHTHDASCVWLAVISDTVYSSAVNPSSAINDESMEHNVIAQQAVNVITETNITRVLLVWRLVTKN